MSENGNKEENGETEVNPYLIPKEKVIVEMKEDLYERLKKLEKKQNDIQKNFLLIE